jgi:hypothetical protein
METILSALREQFDAEQIHVSPASLTAFSHDALRPHRSPSFNRNPRTKSCALSHSRDDITFRWFRMAAAAA